MLLIIDYNFILKYIYVYNTILASHIDTTVLADGAYELIPESVGGDLEAQVNTAVLTEAPDQSSEEPKACVLGLAGQVNKFDSNRPLLMVWDCLTYLPHRVRSER